VVCGASWRAAALRKRQHPDHCEYLGNSVTNLHTLNRRLDRLGGTSCHVSFGEALAVACQRERACEDAWRAAGNTGRPPPEPPTPIEPWPHTVTRADATLWERLARGRARVAHDRCGEASPFRDFTHIYAMSEAELVQAINHAEQIVHQAERSASIVTLAVAGAAR
jgi:hypothetical protein